jgi:hypothetical protein
MVDQQMCCSRNGNRSRCRRLRLSYGNLPNNPRRDEHRTPAMRLGLAKGPVRLEDILYFRPTGCG